MSDPRPMHLRWLLGLLFGSATAVLLSCTASDSTQGAREPEELGVVSAAAGTCLLGQECCPAGYATITLTQNSEAFSTTAANQCVMALGGSDQIAANFGNGIVLCGDGDDTVIAGPTSVVRGGNGNDTINVYGGPSSVYGGPGDDTINAANGNNFVSPGPGRDTVAMGTGNDTVVLYDMCEIVGGGKRLDGGSGTNTLITPIPLAQLIAAGVQVDNFQNIIVQANSCKSECAIQPNCNGQGTCVEGPGLGQMHCQCVLGVGGPDCKNTGACHDDTDRDGISDCDDLCPYDPLKTTPQICGCGRPETNTDGDIAPDCIDECPNDPNNTSRGQCGCVGEVGLKPMGARCTDPACPIGTANQQATSVCDGAGVCGNRSLCVPGTNCRPLTWQGATYWMCGTTSTGGGDAGADAGDGGAPPPGQLTEPAAQMACSAKGLTLTRINSIWQNRQFAPFIPAPLWLGANSIQTANVWRWSAPNTNNGDQFWSGGANGSVTPGRFAFWRQGSPGTQRCATMLPGSGLWVDTNCSETHGYICGFTPPTLVGRIFPPAGIVDKGTGVGPTCVRTADSGLPDTIDALVAQYKLAEAGIFQGAAAAPPPDGSVCEDNVDAAGFGLRRDAGEFCQYADPDLTRDCIVNSDCLPGFLCRQIKNDFDCRDGGCKGKARCVHVVCQPRDTRCNTVEICDPGTQFDAGPDPTSRLDAGSYNPASLFQGVVPDAAPTAQYFDPPGDAGGTAHRWCRLSPQDENSVANATQGPSQAAGQTGSDSVIRFDFKPDLVFDVKANPLALGETKLEVHAAASINTTVTLQNFLHQNLNAQPIVTAGIGIKIDRCSVNTENDTKFQLFGQDILPLDILGIPSINTTKSTDPGFQATQACRNSIEKYVLYADRVKKSFRDAQQLLEQYYQARNAGVLLNGNLCNQIGVLASDIPFFPGGNACPLNEPVEITINRFIDYFQLPGSGQVSQLRNVASELRGATDALQQQPSLKLSELVLKGFTGEESQTILNAPFAIGPIPMVLQVDLFATYGVTGKFVAELLFPVRLEMEPTAVPLSIVRAGARVVPFASAGMSAFVGAGFDLGAISATVGIEGALTLAEVSAPIFAQASLDLAASNDTRALPAGIGPPVSNGAPVFKTPKSFKFSIGYEYGAGIDLQNVLSGEIDGRLRIKFFFFSRTWRSRIVRFNGWSKHFDLLNGGSAGVAVNPQTNEAVPPNPPSGTPHSAGATTQVASGAATMGLSEQQVPLMQLAYLEVPDPSIESDAGTVNFDAGNVSKFFYDDLCCLKETQFCNSSPNARPPCCAGLACVSPPPPPPDSGIITFSSCQKVCKPSGQNCKHSNDCCAPLGCGAIGTCVACGIFNASCTSDADCCSDFFCGELGRCLQAN